MNMPSPGPGLPRPGHEHDQAENPGEDLDEAYDEIQGNHPELDWSEGSQVQAAVSEALEAGFQLGRDFEYRYPD